MADLKVTEALIRDVRALQKATASTKIAEGPREAEARQVDDVVQIDVNLRAQQLTETSPPTEKTQEASAISEQAANLLALNVRQSLSDANLSFARDSEKSILSLFS